jgi:hypothetical protein
MVFGIGVEGLTPHQALISKMRMDVRQRQLLGPAPAYGIEV